MSYSPINNSQFVAPYSGTWNSPFASNNNRFNLPKEQRVYPFQRTGYEPKIPQAPQPNMKPAQTYAALVNNARQNCKTCQTASGDLRPIGCAITTSGGPDLTERRGVRQSRPFPGESFIDQGQGPVFIHDAGSTGQRNPISRKNFITPQYGSYNQELFQMPLDREKPKLSTGVMVNSFTGEVLETFEDAMPPPNTNKAIQDYQFENTNPKLVWMSGGIDPNAKLPSKIEVAQDIPGPDGGPNIWGDQLYEGRRRGMLQEITNRDIWMNRNGDYATEYSMNGEAPAGYVGLQPMYRAIPYLPPTQILDKKDWKGPAAFEVKESNTNPMIVGRVQTRKVDLSDTEYFGNPGSINDQDTTQVVPVVTNRPTWRGATDTDYQGHAEFSDFNAGARVVIDTQPRETLKELMSETFPVTHADFTSVNPGSYVVIDTDPRETQKELMSETFPVFGAQDESTGDYIPFQGELNSTRRQYYSDVPMNFRVSDTVGQGDFVGAGDVFSSQHRGTYETDYVVPTKLPENGGGDTHNRWIGYSDRDVKPKVLCENMRPADFTQDLSGGASVNTVTPRWFPLTSGPCNRRPGDTMDDFLTMRPDYFRET